ncbi:MAG: CamS family sex pheromone protein [Bacillaceae bacterium]
MKKITILVMMTFLLLTGCVPQLQKEDKVTQNTDDTKTSAIIPKYSISDAYYKTLLPFKPSPSRGLIVSNMQNRIDIDAFEEGSLRIATEYFDTKDYLFQEGQTLDKKTIERLVIRQRTAAQQKAIEKQLGKSVPNIGLNPPIESAKSGDTEEKDKARNEASPEYISHILEQNFLVKNKKGNVELGGVVIGLAMNSVHYYNLTGTGYPREYKIPDSKIKAEAEKMAQKILTYIRKEYPKLNKVPIVFTVYKQAPKGSLVPGVFIEKTKVDKGENTIGKWDKIDESYYVFPSDEATKNYRDDATKVSNFKADIVEYFPNYTGVIGKGYYQGNELQEMDLDITIQFNSKAEVIGFTQYVISLLLEHFPSYIKVEAKINSNKGTEAIIIRNPNEDEPFVEIL